MWHSAGLPGEKAVPASTKGTSHHGEKTGVCAMAQVKKERVRRSILAAAREEFLLHGYQKASMRAIASKAQCTLSNVYNYYDGKDALFLAVVQPSLDELFSRLQAAQDEHPPEGEVFLTYEQRRKFFITAIDFIEAHREDLELLVLKSEGSSAHRMHEAAIEAYEGVWFNYMDYVRQNFPGHRIHTISRFFVHNIARFYYNIVVEFLRQQVPYPQMKVYVEELLEYAYGGLRGLLQPEHTPLAGEETVDWSSRQSA